MYDSDCYLIGHGLYPDLARFNHDCDPNAQIVYPFDSMGKRFTRLIATRDIDNGEEVSGEDLSQPTCKYTSKSLTSA